MRRDDDRSDPFGMDLYNGDPPVITGRSRPTRRSSSAIAWFSLVFALVLAFILHGMMYGGVR